MAEKTVNIPSMSCGHCLGAIQREISELAGVTKVSGDIASKTVTFQWEDPADWDQIAATLNEIGYPAQ